MTSLELEFGTRVEMLRFGSGLPSALAPVPNLPSWGDYEAPEISLDSTRALFVDNNSGAYLVSLSGAEETLRVADADAMTRASFCADSDTWVATLGDRQEALVTLKGNELSSRDLGFGYVTLSPNSQLLLMKLIDDWEETLGLHLVGCDDTELVVPLPGAEDATFSSDSKLLLVELLDGGLQVFSLDDPGSPVEIWSDADATLRHGFFDRDRKLLIDYLAGDEEVISTHVVDLTAGEDAMPMRVSLPATASIEAAGASGLLAWSIHSEPRSLLWLPLVADATPLEIFVDPTFTTSELYSVPADPTGVLVARRNGDDTDLSWLVFDSQSYERSLIATFNGASVEAVGSTQDGSGLLVHTRATATDNRLYWIPWRHGEAAEPLLLSERALGAQVQPWP